GAGPGRGCAGAAGELIAGRTHTMSPGCVSARMRVQGGAARGRPDGSPPGGVGTMSPTRVRLLGRTAALLGLLLVPALPATAQSTGTVTGRVVDAATQQPLVGAQVLIEGTGLGGLANDD